MLLMKQTANLKGQWTKQGSEYQNPEQPFTLIMAHRKHHRGNKTLQYLLIKEGNNTRYLSGLYPTKTEGVFRLDYNGKDYTFEELTSKQALIKPKS